MTDLTKEEIESLKKILQKQIEKEIPPEPQTPKKGGWRFPFSLSPQHAKDKIKKYNNWKYKKLIQITKDKITKETTETDEEYRKKLIPSIAVYLELFDITKENKGKTEEVTEEKLTTYTTEELIELLNDLMKELETRLP